MLNRCDILPYLYLFLLFKVVFFWYSTLYFSVSTKIFWKPPGAEACFPYGTVSPFLLCNFSYFGRDIRCRRYEFSCFIQFDWLRFDLDLAAILDLHKFPEVSLSTPDLLCLHPVCRTANSRLHFIKRHFMCRFLNFFYCRHDSSRPSLPKKQKNYIRLFAYSQNFLSLKSRLTNHSIKLLFTVECRDYYSLFRKI